MLITHCPLPSSGVPFSARAPYHISMTTPAPRTRRWLRRLALLLVTLCLLWLASAWYMAYTLAHRKGKPFAEPAPTLAWARFEDVRLRTSDGLSLGGWYAQGRPNLPPVLLLHGKDDCRRHMLPMAQFFAARGHAVLLITQRAHGDSDGDLNDLGLSARHDVIAAVRWLAVRRPGAKPIIFGQSLGAAAAMYAAGDLGGDASAYILESPYTNLYQAVRNRTRMYLPPGLDQLAYAGLVIVAPLVLPDAAALSPADAITRASAQVPILLIGGETDGHSPPDQLRTIHARIASHATLRLVPGSHAALRYPNPAAYDAAVEDFLVTSTLVHR